MKPNSDPVTYFGLYSAAQIPGVSQLLESLQVNFYTVKTEEENEDRLKAWGAWDPLTLNPHEGHELFIYDADVEKVETRLVELNRLSGNKNDGLP
jgi:hypothetical protein